MSLTKSTTSCALRVSSKILYLCPHSIIDAVSICENMMWTHYYCLLKKDYRHDLLQLLVQQLNECSATQEGHGSNDQHIIHNRHPYKMHTTSTTMK